MNRGWVPMGPDRGHLPAIEAPAGEIELRGVLDRPPAPRFAIDRLSRPGPEWGRRWAYLDLGYFVRSTGLSVEPYVMLLDPDAPGGFVREWPRLQDRHHRHLSYAGQWFLLAGVTVCAYLACGGRTGARALDGRMAAGETTPARVESAPLHARAHALSRAIMVDS